MGHPRQGGARADALALHRRRRHVRQLDRHHQLHRLRLRHAFRRDEHIQRPDAHAGRLLAPPQGLRQLEERRHHRRREPLAVARRRLRRRDGNAPLDARPGLGKPRRHLRPDELHLLLRLDPRPPPPPLRAPHPGRYRLRHTLAALRRRIRPHQGPRHALLQV